MEHVSEKTLGLFAIDPARLQHRAAIEAHLGSCSACRAVLDDIRAFDAALGEPETWLVAEGDASSNATGEELRRFESDAAAEDTAAIDLLHEFESSDAAPHFAWANLAEQPDYQTGGVARRLCRLANRMCERMPLYALTLAETATSIAFRLPDTTYPRNTIHELRGDTWKEQANALHYLGRFSDGLVALAQAEAEYNQLPVAGLGVVAVKYLRAGALFEQEQFDAAQALARESADAALALGAVDRYMRARHLEALILFARQQFLESAAIFARVLEYGERQNDPIWVARESLGLANCYIEVDRADEAERHAHRALRLFLDAELTSNVTRARWAIARLGFVRGKTIESISGLRSVIRELTTQGMLTDSAIAAVHLAEILNATGRAREIPKLLAGVVETFVNAGKVTGALTALAHLKEAAAQGTMNRPLLSYIRRFIERADRQPELLFRPPAAP